MDIFKDKKEIMPCHWMFQFDVYTSHTWDLILRGRQQLKSIKYKNVKEEDMYAKKYV